MNLEVNIFNKFWSAFGNRPYIEGYRDVIDDETALLRYSYMFCMCQDSEIATFVVLISKLLVDFRCFYVKKMSFHSIKEHLPYMSKWAPIWAPPRGFRFAGKFCPETNQRRRSSGIGALWLSSPETNERHPPPFFFGWACTLFYFHKHNRDGSILQWVIVAEECKGSK